MRLLSSFLFLFICFSCISKKESKQSIPEAPDVIFGTSQKAQDISIETFLDNAQSFYQAKQYKELKEYLDKYSPLFTKPQEKKQISLLRAMNFIITGDVLQAQSLLLPLTKEKEPNIKGKALFYLGDTYRIKKEYKKAINTFLMAYKFLPNPEILSSLGDTYSQLKSWDQAIHYYKRVLDLDPFSSQDLFFMGIAFFEKGDLKKAKSTMEELLKVDPKDARAYQYLTQIALKQGERRNGYYYKSRELLLKRDYKKTSELLSGVDLVYKEAILSSFLITSLTRQRDVKGALQAYKKAVEQTPSLASDPSFKVYYGILEVLPSQGKKEGLLYFKQLVKEYPQDFFVLSSYSELIEDGDKNAPLLESLYLKILSIDPTDKVSRYKLSNWYQNHGKVELSQMEYSILYYYQDQKDNALESLLNFEKLYPKFKNIQIPLYIGLLYQERGEREWALKYYRKGLEIDPKNKIAHLAIKNLAESK